MTAGASSEPTLIHVRNAEELAWRTQRMTRLGADEAFAAAVAASAIDLHAFERLVKDGCTLDLAWAITRPSTEPASPAAHSQAVEVGAGDQDSRGLG